MAVYFIRHGNYIKIGKSVDPWKRLASLQTAHHDTLEMLAIMPGSDDQFHPDPLTDCYVFVIILLRFGNRR